MRAFPRVHRRIRTLDLKYAQVAEMLNMPASTFSDKMSGRIPWRLPEVFRLLDIIADPDEGLDQYFPREVHK